MVLGLGFNVNMPEGGTGENSAPSGSRNRLEANRPLVKATCVFY